MAANSTQRPCRLSCRTKLIPRQSSANLDLRGQLHDSERHCHHLLTLGYVPLLQRAQQAVRPNLPLGPVLLPWIVLEKLVEPLIPGGFEAKKIDILQPQHEHEIC